MDEKLNAVCLAERLAEKRRSQARVSLPQVNVSQELERVYQAARVRFPPANLDKLGQHLRVLGVREVPLAIRGRLVVERGSIVVEINQQLSWFEKRRVLAHELAHLIFDRERVRSGFFGTRGRVGESQKEYINIEQTCDAAADEILLPEKWLFVHLPKEPSLRVAEDIGEKTNCTLDFVANRILRADLWRGCRFMWWGCRGEEMVVERILPEEDGVGLSFYERLDARSSLPARALVDDGVVRGKVWISNGIVSRDYRAECMRVSESEVVALIV